MNDGAGGPDGIAGTLEADAKNLKIVVLNGCSTRRQVETFFRRGVQVVVATRCAVKDAHAMLFAITFHRKLAEGKAIEIAYRDAILAARRVADLAQLLPESVLEKSVDVRGGMLDTSYPTDVIWGLFTRKTGADTVKMAIWHRSSGGNHKINPEKACICERDKAPYSDTFSEYFKPRNPNRSRIQHYLLAGARTESPLGLIRKFFYESVMQSLDRQFYYYLFMDLPGENKVIELKKTDSSVEYILQKLLSSVKGPMLADTNSTLLTPNDLCAQFFGYTCFTQREYVLIAFRVPPEALTDKTTQAILAAIRQLNEWSEKLPPGRLSFLFFWTIEQE